jgi:oxygen-independent coproporphyrinogen-3 oxidase
MADRDPWHPVKRLEEALFMGLRLREGIDAQFLGERYGVDIQGAFGEVWDTAEQRGLVVREGNIIRLTRAGCLGSNAVFGALIDHLPVE